MGDGGSNKTGGERPGSVDVAQLIESRALEDAINRPTSRERQVARDAVGTAPRRRSAIDADKLKQLLRGNAEVLSAVVAAEPELTKREQLGLCPRCQDPARNRGIPDSQGRWWHLACASAALAATESDGSGCPRCRTAAPTGELVDANGRRWHLGKGCVGEQLATKSTP
jgi:hypothetical protein